MISPIFFVREDDEWDAINDHFRKPIYPPCNEASEFTPRSKWMGLEYEALSLLGSRSIFSGDMLVLGGCNPNQINPNHTSLVGGFKYFLVSPLLGEMIQFD